MSKKKIAPIHSYPADGNQPNRPREIWKQEYLEKLKACSNEELFGDDKEGGPWDDLTPDYYDGEYTGRGGWMAGEVENEIRRRLGVPETENRYG